MQPYGVNQLRKMFLEFFESKGHLAMKSFSLVPHNDKSLLLINSGMAPLKPYFTGQEIPPRRRVTTCQKCIRTGDIENVGKTAEKGKSNFVGTKTLAPNPKPRIVSLGTKLLILPNINFEVRPTPKFKPLFFLVSFVLPGKVKPIIDCSTFISQKTLTPFKELVIGN